MDGCGQASLNHKLKLFVDDERPRPDNSWTLAVSSKAAIYAIEAHRASGLQIDTISLDHDLSTRLGYDDDTRGIMLYMCEHDYWPKNLYVHTANPCGEEWLVGMTKRYGPPNVLKGYGPDYWKNRK